MTAVSDYNGIKNATSNWYAVYTMPRTEKKVEQRLIDKGFEVYLPLVSTIRMWSDRKKKVKMPLIPGYIFIQSEEKTLFESLSVQGALGIIRHLGKPAKIRDYEIENLKLLQKEPNQFQAIHHMDIKQDQLVKITYGPLQGMIGKCIRTQGKFQVVISIQSIGHSFQVSVSSSHLEKTH